MKIKIASWNIAGGRKVNSSQRFDYGQEELSYFSKNLKKINPDIICIQENHFRNGESYSKRIVNILGSYNVFDYELSPSHIDADFRLGLSILSKSIFKDAKNFVYPYPEFELNFKDGQPASRHNKGFQILKTDDIFIANTQLLPIGLFGHLYSSGDGMILSKKIEDLFFNNLKLPLIFCGDFSGDFNGEFDKVFGKFLDKFNLQDALTGKKTRNIDSEIQKKLKTDYIFYSSEFRLIKSEVVETNTDHFLCYAEFEI